MAAQQPGDAGNRKSQMEQQDLEIRKRLSQIKNKILVMSGKGGVGKSSVAAYLAVGLAKEGFKVGLMDVDLHGPSIPRMLGLKEGLKPGFGGKAQPASYLPNLEVVSIESLMGEDKDVATIWRGPLKIGVIKQFIADIEWSELDYLVIDSPPGTGDEPLTVAQTIPDAKAIVVTTPQEISLADVRKSINFCRMVNMSILGIVENMSGLTCPHCGQMIDIFKTLGGMITAKQQGLRLLGSLPFEPRVVQNGDTGNMGILTESERPFTQAMNAIVQAVISDTWGARRDAAAPGAPAAEPPAAKTGGERKVFMVPVFEGKLAAHFGHAEGFARLETDDGRIVDKQMLVPPAHEPGVLPRWIHDQGAQIVIVGGMGQRAQELLREKGVQVIVGAPTDTPEALVEFYLSDQLVSGANICDH